MNYAALIKALTPLAQKLGGKLWLNIPMKVRQFLGGAMISLSIAGGTLVISTTTDSCSVQYVTPVDVNDTYPLDKDTGDTIQFKTGDLE